jgi:hypothetical protein
VAKGDQGNATGEARQQQQGAFPWFAGLQGPCQVQHPGAEGGEGPAEADTCPQHQLFALAEKLSRNADPVEGLRKWLHANIRLVATKKGMVEALQLVAHGSSELKTYSFQRLTAAIALLLDQGVTAGVFRSDVSAEELLRALVGIFYSQSGKDWQPGALRLVNVFVDGLCGATSARAKRRKSPRLGA